MCTHRWILNLSLAHSCDVLLRKIYFFSFHQNCDYFLLNLIIYCCCLFSFGIFLICFLDSYYAFMILLAMKEYKSISIEISFFEFSFKFSTMSYLGQSSEATPLNWYTQQSHLYYIPTFSYNWSIWPTTVFG